MSSWMKWFREICNFEAKESRILWNRCYIFLLQERLDFFLGKTSVGYLDHLVKAALVDFINCHLGAGQQAVNLTFT